MNPTIINPFAIVGWEQSDLEDALAFHNLPTTPEHVGRVYKHIRVTALTDAMVEAGWDYIYGVIRELYPNWG